MATQIYVGPMKKKVATTMDLVEDNNEYEEEEEEGSVLSEENSHLKRKKMNLEKKKGANNSYCQVEKCGVDLDGAKLYHKRHKVCPVHAKAPIVLLAGLSQRFCQQCSRFHELSEFDGTKKSCRQRLAGHNKRRRKTPLAIELEDNQYRKINGEARPHMDITLSSTNTSFENYHVHTADISG